MHFQEHVMSTNKDQVRGRVKQAKGRIKEVAGKLLGDERLQAKGNAQKTLGKAQARFGDVKQHVKDSSKIEALTAAHHSSRPPCPSGRSCRGLLAINGDTS